MKFGKIGAAALTAVMLAASVTGVLPDVMSVTASAATTYTEGNLIFKEHNDGTLYLSGVTDTNIKSVVVPATVKGKKVTAIGTSSSWGDRPFKNCNALTSVTISEGITYIGYGMFSGRNLLKTVKLPSTLTKIDYYAFEGCKSLTSISLLGDVNLIGSYAFQNCTNLETVYISQSMAKINYYAFNGCSSLKDVYYTGSEDEWKIIDIDTSYNTGNKDLINAEKHYGYDPNAGKLAAADMNDDGKLNAKDATEILKIVAGLREKDDSKGDVNKDDKINAKDAAEILKWIAGMPSALDDL